MKVRLTGGYMSKKKCKYLILGAGPAGLGFANRLLELGETDFLVLEKEKEAGGLCRSMEVDGSPLDIGGGHFLDVRRPKVNEFLFRFMKEEEWDRYERDSRIQIGDDLVGHPLEANIWQMSLEKQVAYLKSIAIAGCNLGTPMPQEFVKWIYWKLGERIAEDYMIPYNRKMFGEELDRLGTYWLNKLPDVSFEETLLSCLTKKAYGTQPGHAEFYYPKKYGYGELWRRMAERIGDRICCNTDINVIDFLTNTVSAAHTETCNGYERHQTCSRSNHSDSQYQDSGHSDSYQGEIIVNTIPWTEFQELLGMPEKLQEKIRELKYSSVVIEYVPKGLHTKAHWIYYPEEALPYHRILVRHNFCPGADGYWTETNKKRAVHREDRFSYENKYAYPLNTIEKPEIMKEVLDWCRERKVFGLGRWGEWEHYNSDAVVERAMELADSLWKA